MAILNNTKQLGTQNKAVMPRNSTTGRSYSTMTPPVPSKVQQPTPIAPKVPVKPIQRTPILRIPIPSMPSKRLQPNKIRMMTMQKKRSTSNGYMTK